MHGREQLANQQKILGEFGAFALQSEDLDAVLHKACELVAEAVGTRRAKILEIEPGGETLFVRAGVGWTPDIVGQLRLPMHEHSSETYSIRAGEPVVSQDIAAETRFEVPDFMKAAGIAALANVPIFLPRDEVFGLLQVDASEPHRFSRDDLDFLRTCAVILGPVIDRLRKIAELAQTRERFQLIVENALDYAVILCNADDRIADWLPGAEAVFGWTREEILGQPAGLLFTPEDRERHIDRLEMETARETGEALNRRWHLHKSGRRVFIDGTVKALRDREGSLTGYIKIGQDVTEQRFWQERQRVLIEGVPQLVWRAEGVGEWTWSSPQWSAFTGQSEADSRGLGWLEKIHPDDRGAAMAAWQSAERRGAIDVEYRLHHRSEDRYRWFRTRAAPVRDRPDGPVKEWLGTSTDIDDLRRMQDQQQVMVAELQHRTRNLIAVVHSIARQTARTIDDMGEFQRQFSDRLTALSRVQGLLSKSDTTPIEIGDLVAMELDALGIEMGERVEVEGPPVALRSGVVQTLALAIHELATNARKYGALTTDDGMLYVRWAVHEDKADGSPWLAIEWREDNIIVARELQSPATTGYGRELIESALPYSLGARTSYELAGTSLLCTIDMPLKRREPKEASDD